MGPLALLPWTAAQLRIQKGHGRGFRCTSCWSHSLGCIRLGYFAALAAPHCRGHAKGIQADILLKGKQKIRAPHQKVGVAMVPRLERHEESATTQNAQGI
jgi:hypothetical protein